MADWKKIKAEYISGGTSYRKLAAKYGVPFSALRRLALKEKWTDLRTQSEHKANTAIVNKTAEKAARQVDRTVAVADKILDAIERKIDNGEYTMIPAEVKQLTSALRDIKEVKNVKTEAELREQEARIRKLEREAAGETQDNEITVVISGGLEEYAQ